MPNRSLTTEPFGIGVMNVKIWTKDIFYSHFFLKGKAVIFTCRDKTVNGNELHMEHTHLQ